MRQPQQRHESFFCFPNAGTLCETVRELFLMAEGWVLPLLLAFGEIIVRRHLIVLLTHKINRQPGEKAGFKTAEA